MSDRPEDNATRQPSAARLYDSGGREVHAQSQSPRGNTDQLMDFIHEQPVSAVLLAFAFGYFAGKIL